MSITLNKAINLNAALVALINNDRENKLVFPSAVRYRLATNVAEIKPALERYTSENNKLVEKYGSDVPGKPGDKQVVQDSENWPKFKEEFESLLKGEINCNIRPITEDELSSAETKEFRVDVLAIVSMRDLGILVQGPAVNKNAEDAK